MILFMKPCRRHALAETDSFTKRATSLWSESEIDAMKDYLSLNPLVGDEIPGTGGVRKMRWTRPGMGKRGGARIIYYFYDETAPIYLLWAYAKNQQGDLKPSEKEAVTKAAEIFKAMAKSKRRTYHD